MKFRFVTCNVLYVFFLFTFLLLGCAKPSALKPDVNAIDISQESIAILTAKVENKYRPVYQPHVISVFLKDKGINILSFTVDLEYNNQSLISFQLPPGKYELIDLLATCGEKYSSIGTLEIPINSSFEIEANKIIYLGNIEAYLIEKTRDDELDGGPLFPLIDQGIVGALGGTFVVKINDLFQNDIELFKKQYPYLSNYNIENMTLPPWKKPTK